MVYVCGVVYGMAGVGSVYVSPDPGDKHLHCVWEG